MSSSLNQSDPGGERLRHGTGTHSNLQSFQILDISHVLLNVHRSQHHGTLGPRPSQITHLYKELGSFLLGTCYQTLFTGASKCITHHTACGLSSAFSSGISDREIKSCLQPQHMWKYFILSTIEKELFSGARIAPVIPGLRKAVQSKLASGHKYLFHELEFEF